MNASIIVSSEQSSLESLASPATQLIQPSVDREVLAQRVINSINSIATKLTNLEPDIRLLWTEFENLPKGDRILGCSTKKEFCEKYLGRTPRAIQYLLNGGNLHRTEYVRPSETVSLQPTAGQGRKTWVKMGTDDFALRLEEARNEGIKDANATPEEVRQKISNGEEQLLSDMEESYQNGYREACQTTAAPIITDAINFPTDTDDASSDEELEATAEARTPNPNYNKAGTRLYGAEKPALNLFIRRLRAIAETNPNSPFSKTADAAYGECDDSPTARGIMHELSSAINNLSEYRLHFKERKKWKWQDSPDGRGRISVPDGWVYRLAD